MSKTDFTPDKDKTWICNGLTPGEAVKMRQAACGRRTAHGPHQVKVGGR